MALQVVPVLLGQGRRLFDDMPPELVELELVHTLEGPGSVHQQQLPRLDGRRRLANALCLTLVPRPLQGRAGLFDLGARMGRAARDEGVRTRALRELEAAAESFLASLAPYDAP